MEFVSPEGLRLDGRRPMEMRQLRAEIGTVSRADGSAVFEMGNTKVIAAVYGPREAMEDKRSFNSPRRTLSYSRNRGVTFSVFEADNKASGVGVSGEHGPNPSEVYGFVGAISTVVTTVIFMIWAYIPDPWLHSIGIFYYPSKYWALALPAYAIVTAAAIFIFYVGLNFMATPPPTSLNLIYDENSKDPVCFDPTLDEDDRPIEPYSDIGIDQINELMLKDWK